MLKYVAQFRAHLVQFVIKDMVFNREVAGAILLGQIVGGQRRIVTTQPRYRRQHHEV